MSEVPVVSAVAPGANAPPDMSMSSVSTVPALPEMEIVSVFVVVAAPHAAPPNQISLPETLSTPSSPLAIEAVTDCAVAL